MEIAPLRQRAVELLTQRPRHRAEEPSELPVYAAELFRLAHIAVGDADSAAALVADVLAAGAAGTYPDQATALRLLIQRLPPGWLSWPGAAGPAEWLRMRLRREQADRLLSVLGEWDAPARVALGLWLLWNLRRDELDGWLGTQGMGDRIDEFVGYVGEGLDLVTKPGEGPSCEDVAADLIDAHDPQVGRVVRLHILGCEPCRRRVTGLRSTTQVLRNALDAFFRAPPPPDLPRLVALRRRQLRARSKVPWQRLLIAFVVLMFYIGIARKPAATAEPVPAPPSATELIDRALNRFANDAAREGVLHERIKLNDDGAQFSIERWYDYGSAQRTRITVRRGPHDPPLLDLSTDGIEWVAYDIDTGIGTRHTALVRRRETPRLVPLFRQLPVVGSFGAAVVPQRYLDINMLAAARRGNPSLLGMIRWQGRAAYTLMSTTALGERMSLTVDQETLSLLEARITPAGISAASARRVWQAELVEVLPRTEVASTTFKPIARASAAPLTDPRQLDRQSPAYIDLDSAAAATTLSIPEVLPEPPMLAYLRFSRRSRSSIVQVYEGRWSTLVVVTPRRPDPSRYEPLGKRFEQGRFAEVEHSRPDTTIIEFALDALPAQRMRMYLWHALATQEERTALSHEILNSLKLVDSRTIERLRDRFIDPRLEETTGSSKGGSASPGAVPQL